MPKYPTSILALSFSLAILSAAPAIAANGQIFITQAKALAGNVTPGDASGYPVTLSKPGSYELAGNLAVSAGSVGIHIAAGDVTVDLNGFRIAGSGTASIGIDGPTNGATIRNGTIDHFKNHGIYLTGSRAIVEDMRVVENGGHGIRTGGDAQIRSSTAAKNGLGGVVCFAGCLVERSTAANNDGNGISCGPSCHAEGNLVSFNGVNGVNLFDGGLALGNTISGNAGFGISGGGSAPAVYGNNALTQNNAGGGGTQAQGVSSLHANYCYPGACP